MAYFPFFMDIAGKRGVILGGGRIAAGKIAALLPFAPQLVCIAPVICGEIERMAASLPEGQGGLRLIYRGARKADLDGAFFVVAAFLGVVFLAAVFLAGFFSSSGGAPSAGVSVTAVVFFL